MGEMSAPSLDIAEKIRKWIEGRDVTLILSATTGYGLQPYFSLVENGHVKLIVVVAHRIGNPRWKPFDPKIRNEVEQRGGVILQEKILGAIWRLAPMLIAKYFVPLFGYREKNWEELLAVGGRVCLQITEIAAKENRIGRDSIVVAVAGEYAALALKIIEINPPRMALLDIIFRNDIQLD